MICIWLYYPILNLAPTANHTRSWQDPGHVENPARQGHHAIGVGLECNRLFKVICLEIGVKHPLTSL
jgi:hypothetical protein